MLVKKSRVLSVWTMGAVWIVLCWLGWGSHAQAACEPPDLLIVLDRSCSMAGSKWSAAVNAVNTITNQYNGKLRFGLETFHSSASINYGIDRCIRDGSRCVSNLQSTLRSLGPTGGTNLQSAITTAQSHLTTIRNQDSVKTRKRSVMFITDGQATCAQSQVANLLSSLGVQTYVIGFGSGVDSNCLNNMATAGGTARSGSRKYYQADNSSELNSAMSSIANAASQEVCNNLDDDCDGQIDEGLSRSCRTNCGTGTEVCSRGSWVNCTARQPTAEKCNGLDDDCNGQVDENWSSTLGRPCTVGTGNCQRSGQYICHPNGTTVTCSATPGGGTAERCNGIDDNCNGQIDEDWPAKGTPCTSGTGICARNGTWICDSSGSGLRCSATPGPPQTEVCNGLDDNCNGQIDEGVTRSCQSICGSGTESCSNGRWVNCNARQPSPEKCNGIDDDCNGQIDENWSQKNDTCVVGVGACQRTGQYVCNAAQNGLECSAKPGNPVAELCNGIDDNCNGQIDETWSQQKGTPCTSGTGACQRPGVWICNSSGSGLTCSATPGPPQTEVCNGIDDNCNGQIDENWPTKGTPCNAGTGSCQRTGQWVCKPDTTGLQCSVSSGNPQPETCNGIDDDCDGQVDEGLTRSCQTICETGTETCSMGQWINCTARKPSPEVCNGKDDNCDGKIDENWPTKNSSCTVGIGNCANTGTWVCKPDGSDVECSVQPKAPEPEKCNGQDDDCDGQIDENWSQQKGTPCTVGIGNCKNTGVWVCNAAGSGLECSVKPGQPQPEKCNNQDDDCNGQIDENLTQTCQTICGTGTEVCNNGQWVNCTARKPTPETCNGLDDDCDGQIDENWPKKNTVCTVGVGSCQRTGVWICEPDGADVQCSVQPGQPQQETCNGQDDNCDGQIDETWTKKGTPCTQGIGECISTGVWICKADGSDVECSAKPGQPQQERCNGKDDNCDGRIDEDWPDKGKACTDGLGICASTGTWVCKQDESGLECNAVQGIPQAEECNGKDDDCDGNIDEAVTRPCQTICGAGTEICNNGQWVSCDAQQPVAETCNGKDDDCNGLVDDKWPLKGTPCTVGVGACANTGVWQCKADGTGLECSVTPKPPQNEICDGIDNDCDGQVDEDWPDKGKPCKAGTGSCDRTGQYVCTPDGTQIRCSSPGGAPTAEICDGIDNDCNGVIDDGLIRACQTACGSGVETCNQGKWQGCTAPEPKQETCNGKDDDCNGKIDEDLSRVCETPCGKGKETCNNGRWQNCTAAQPQPEICDNLDNDCNGLIDDLPAKPCLGDCGQGQAKCEEGVWTGCSGPSPQTETCNGKDDDCDGKVDNGLSRPCRSDCGIGTEICQNGQWTLCNAPAAQPEVCNGKDDDCDGVADNNAPCPEGLHCVQGSCRPKCRNAECPGGMQCVNDICFGDACRDQKCPSDQQCVGGRCVDPCTLINCPQGYLCRQGICIKDDCYIRGCPSAQRCVNGACVSNPCDGVSCQSNEFCREGKCVPSCAQVQCAADQKCVDGKCVEDSGKTGRCKDVSCPAGHNCVEGKCVADPCYDTTCVVGQSCIEGRCQHDPCHNIKCPEGQVCRDNQCYAKPPDSEKGIDEGQTSDGGNPEGTSTNPEDQSSQDGQTSNGDNGQDPNKEGTQAGQEEGSQDKLGGNPNQVTDLEVPRYAPGCGCQSSPVSFSMLLFLALLSLVLLRKRGHKTPA